MMLEQLAAVCIFAILFGGAVTICAMGLHDLFAKAIGKIQSK